MPDQNQTETTTGTGSESTSQETTGSEQPTAEEQQAMSKAQDESFGVSDGDPGDPGASKSNDSEKTEASTESKENQEATSADDQSKKEEAESNQQTKKFGGKFDSVEAMEEGYANQEKFIGTLKSENKEALDKIKELQGQLGESKPAKTDTDDTSTSQKSPTDDPDYLKMAETLNDTLGEEEAKPVLDYLAKFMQTAGAKTPTDPTILARLDRVDQERFDRLEKQFKQENPDYEKDFIQQSLDQIQKELGSLEPDDHLTTMKLMYDVARGRNLKRLVDEAVELRMKNMSKNELQKRMSEGLASGTSSGGDTAPGATTGDKSMIDQQKEAFGDLNAVI